MNIKPKPLWLIFSFIAPLLGAPIAKWSLSSAPGGVVQDLVGKSPGRLVGEAIFAPSPNGQALEIEEGLTHVEIPTTGPVGLENQFSIFCLVKPNGVRGYRTILWKGNRGAKPERVGYYLNLRDGKVEFKAKTEAGEWVAWATTEPCVRDRRWCLIAVRFQGGVCRIEVNGANLATSTPPGVGKSLTALVPNDDPLVIGVAQAAGGSPGYPWNGHIGEVIFDNDPEAIGAPNTLQRSFLFNIADSLSEIQATAQIITERLKILQESGAPTSLGRENLSSVETTLSFLLKSDLLPAGLSRVPGAGPADRKGPAVMKALQGEISRLRAACQVLLSGSAYPNPGELFAFQQELDGITALQEWADLLGAQALRAREAALFPPKATFAAVPCPAGVTLEANRNCFSRVPSETNFSVELGRNEVEGFQVFLLPHKDEMASFTLDASASPFLPVSGGPALPPVEISPMKPVDNRATTSAVPFKGEIFDAILDGEQGISVKENRPAAAFVRVRADADTAPGLYRGIIQFRRGSETRVIAFDVRVRNFTLPEKTTLRVTFTFPDRLYKDWYGLSSIPEGQMKSVNQFLHEYRLAANNIYSGDVFPDGEARKLIPGANFSTAGYYGPKGPQSDDTIEAAVGDLKTRVKDALAAGIPQDDLYHYCWDEYGMFSRVHFDPPTVEKYMSRVKEEMPKLKLMQTSMPLKPFDTWWNVWVPLLSEFRHMNPEILKRPGTEAWWYWVSDPAPYPNFFLGLPTHESRMALFIGSKYKLRGCLYWSIIREWPQNKDLARATPPWPEAPWDARYVNIFTKKDNLECGQGNLAYPGPGGRLWPSLRLENIRDGIEDYEYLAVLRRAVENPAKGAKPLPAGLLSEAKTLLAIPDEVVQSTSKFTRNPATLAAFRSRVAQALENIQQINPLQETAMKKETRLWKVAAAAVMASSLSASSPTPPTPSLWLDFSKKPSAESPDRTGKQIFLLKAPDAQQSGSLRLKKGTDAKVRHSSALDELTRDITITTWVAVKGVSENFQTLLFKGDRGAKPERIQFALSLNHGYPEFKFKDAAGNWQGFMKSSAETKTAAVKNALALKPGVWTHLAVTYTPGMATVFLNGVKTETVKVAAGDMVANADDLSLGSMVSGGEKPYPVDGALCDLRIYPSVLGGAEILSIYSEQKARAESSASLE